MSRPGARPLLLLPLLAGLLAGCSVQIFEEVGEINVPRHCAETSRLFNTFSMRAKSVSWKASKAGPPVLTVALVFENDKKWPIALSNSGNGVLYDVEFSLHGEKGALYTPKEATGVALAPEAKPRKERPAVGLFSQPIRNKPSKQVKEEAEKRRDVNFRIKPGEPQEGQLVFEAPKQNYLLTIERKFAAKPVAGSPTDYIAVCRISTNEFSYVNPPPRRGPGGVY